MTNIIEVNEDNFDNEVINSNLPVLVDFWAPWCGPCRMLGPLLESLSVKFNGKVKFVKVNVDSNPTLSIKYNIQGIPFVLIFSNGVIQGQPLVGVRSPNEYETILNGLVGNNSNIQNNGVDNYSLIEIDGQKALDNALNTDKLVLIDFWAPWCGPCRMLGPVLEKLADEFSNKLLIIKINVDNQDNIIIAENNQVSSIPQVSFIKNGKNIDQFIGALPYESIKSMILKYL